MAFDGFAKRNFGIAIGGAIVLSAFLSARGVVRIAEAAVAVDAKMIAGPPTQNTPPIEQSKNEKSAQAILARNPFDSITGPLSRSASDSAATSVSAPTCEGMKVLIIAQASDPDWSFAALTTNEADAKSQLRRRGGDFAGKKVELIDWDRVWFSQDGSFCQVELFAQHQPDNTKKDPPRLASGLDMAIARGIHRTSATQFEIDRGVLDKILENQAELMKVRVVPEQEKGAPAGIRLFGIKEGSLFGVIGLENGDRIESLNGLELNTPQQALEAYARLRVAEHLKVQINRKGTEMQIDYDIR